MNNESKNVYFAKRRAEIIKQFPRPDSNDPPDSSWILLLFLVIFIIALIFRS